MMKPVRRLATAYILHRSCSQESHFCNVVYMNVLIGCFLVFLRRLANRSVCSKVGPQGSGMENWARAFFFSRLLICVRLKTRASAIFYTLRAH